MSLQGILKIVLPENYNNQVIFFLEEWTKSKILTLQLFSKSTHNDGWLHSYTRKSILRIPKPWDSKQETGNRSVSNLVT